jgi:hypothetical protein
VGGPGSGRRPKPENDVRLGHGSVTHEDPRYLSTTRAQRQPVTVVPEASGRWHATARSWFNSLKLSGQSDFFQASDWMMAVTAAEMYDRFLRTDNASILAQFVRVSERLGCTELDRKRGRIELVDGGARDEDKERAAGAVISWKNHLGIVRGTGEDA